MLQGTADDQDEKRTCLFKGVFFSDECTAVSSGVARAFGACDK
jgi:hypothetical protein